MAKLNTPIDTPDFGFKVRYDHQLLSLGSCFSEHIGERLQRRKFRQVVNPYGIIYHPLVMAELLSNWLDGPAPNASDLFEEQHLWRHYDFHSRYSHPEKTTALENMQRQYQSVVALLPKLDVLFITWGTAYGYQLTTTGKWVNNCHKRATSLFQKKRSSPEQIVSGVEGVLLRLKALNPQLQIILTISPVRHLRDGLIENQRSKAALLLASEMLTQQLDFVHYFPAYEILLDELRDYRYYAKDLLHPNELAVDIIWERFAGTIMSEETQRTAEEAFKIVQAGQHRQQHPESLAAKNFEKALLHRISVLTEKYPYLDFSEEIERIQSTN